MSDVDVRDERLAGALDLAVRGVEPAMSPERAIRKGDLRRAVRLTASLATVAVFVVGAIWGAAIVGSDDTRPVTPSELATFSSPEAPWTFEYPSGWELGTVRNEGPELRANMLRTTIVNEPLGEAAAFGPNSGPGDELVAALGDDGAAVLVQRFWGHAAPLDCEDWGPRAFVDDASNPGWVFRERHRSDGTLCFAVLEWFGPDASDEDRAAAGAIADSARLGDLERWTETDGEFTTLHDEDDGFTVTYPSDWVPSETPINEEVCSPFEILAIASYPLRPGGGAVMDGMPIGNAIDDLGPEGVLVWVADVGNACGGERSGGGGGSFPDRPGQFGPVNVCEDFDRLCPSDGRDMIPGIRAWWMGFQDADRGFYVFVGMGEQAFADPARARLAWDVLDSLRFLPR